MGGTKRSSLNAARHPYCRDNFRGTPEIRETFARIDAQANERTLLNRTDMPYKEKEIERIYFDIGQACEEISNLLPENQHVTASSLRFWEEKVPELRSARRLHSHNRYYHKDQIPEWARFISIVYTHWFTLTGAIHFFKSGYDYRNINNKTNSYNESQSN